MLQYNHIVYVYIYIYIYTIYIYIYIYIQNSVYIEHNTQIATIRSLMRLGSRRRNKAVPLKSQKNPNQGKIG